MLWYRFRARRAGEGFRVLKDYGPEETLDWTVNDYDGSFEIEVTVRNIDTKELAVARERFDMLSNATAGQPAIVPTWHPLLFF